MSKEYSDYNIMVLTPVYPGEGVHKSTTPVVHYFTREWVKMGYNVLVVHCPVNFPTWVYALISPFKEKIGSKVGSEIRTWPVSETEYKLEGVAVKRIPLTKTKPHGRYSKNQIAKAVEKTIAYCSEKEFKPDVIISHWVNPSFEIMHHLKSHYHVPTCYVAHDAGHDLKTIMKDVAEEFIRETDVIGYRSGYIKRSFEAAFNCGGKPNFLCSSGVPESYMAENYREFNSVKSFVFVGTLIQRKYPAQIIPAVCNAYGNDDFSITYIGDGDETTQVKAKALGHGVEEKVHLLGRKKRDEVVDILDKSDVFVMISRGETFGLVYLEAMARGCITIAAKNEGFDGIIVNGENGFLCEAGNVEELTSIIKQIRNMDEAELNRISRNALDTARNLTDVKAAKFYLDNVLSVKVKHE